MSTTSHTTTEAFQRGIACGKRGIFRGTLTVEPSEDGIIDIIRNLIEFAKDDPLTEEQLRQDVGIVVGFVLANPHVFA